MKKLLVIGGGLTGLSAAWHARRAGAEVRLLESAPRVGGVVQTFLEDGFLVEAGPNTLLIDTPETETRLRALGLDSEIVAPAPAARQRFVVRAGRLAPVPLGPRKFLTTPLLSARAKLRLLCEPWAPRRAPAAPGEESVADFARRRLGPEALAYLVNPFVAGVYAGDPELLAVRLALPKLSALEAAHGSLARAAWTLARQRKKGGFRPRSISFRRGMAALPRALAAQLPPESLATGARLLSLETAADRNWTAVWSTAGGEERAQFDGVVVAVAAPAVARLPLPAELHAQLAPLAAVAHPPVGVVALGYRRENVRHPLDGFGCLVPAAEPFHILGALFTSSLFPDRAPAGQVLLTVFVGGARRPEAASLPDEVLLQLVRDDLGKLLGAQGLPSYQRIVRWPEAIPQYGLHHGAALDACAAAEHAWPGLALAGSHRGGVAAAQCLAGGGAAAWRALSLASATAT